MPAYPGYSQASTNRIQGQFFEEAFQKRAYWQGLLPVKNLLAAQPKGKGRWQPVKSQLDWNLYKRGGQCAIVDCKSFDKAFFTYSDLNRSQLTKSLEFNRWLIPSGFVVWFRPVNLICFYTGYFLEKKGPGNRFLPSQGQLLGKLENFTLEPIFNSSVVLPEFYSPA